MQSVNTFIFGPLEITVQNPDGVFFPSENLKSRIAGMTREEAAEANKAAWRLRKQYERVMNRCHNVTRYPGVYDSVAGRHTITECVCKLTYKRMMA